MVTEIFDKLRQLTQIDIQSSWLSISEEISFDDIDIYSWKPVNLNQKGYIVWPAGRKIKWLAKKLIIPKQIKGYPLSGLALRLSLTWWAEKAEIFINKKLVQEGDLFDSSARILVSPSVKPRDEFLILLRLVSPGHDIGGLMSSRLIYETDVNLIDPGFVADELTILYNYLSAFEPQAINLFKQLINQINWDIVNDQKQFNCHLFKLRNILKPLAKNIKEYSLNLLGHAHLDMAWLWPVDETWDVGERTFTSVISLQKEFTDLIFGHTTPVLYEWMEKHRPQLFKKILEAYKQGKWEILGGMWVEPEVNLASGESIVRQLLYGQRFFREKFGKITQVAWLPDSFGFTWQLSQIFHQSGIKYFVTGKLHWNTNVKFPYGLFYWQSPDGTQLLTLISPPNVAGVMNTDPLKMTNYSISWKQQTGLKDALWLPGVGDHGGGPTRDMLTVQNRWKQSPFFPKISFTKTIDYLDKLGETSDYIPVWNDELYLDLHRGCYTTHADQKFYNRRCEDLLYQAELWISIATIVQGLPINLNEKNDLERAWKKVLFNQFHDILPGTSIPEVFIQANEDWQQVIKISQALLDDSLQAIISRIDLPKPPTIHAIPLMIFNSLNWQRSEVIECPDLDNNYEIYDLEGNELTSQLSIDNKLLFLAKNIPSIGYRVFWLCPTDKTSENIYQINNSDFNLENQYLKVTINSKTGNIDSIFDKIVQQEVVKGECNQLQGFQDKGQYWDAWNIDPNYNNKPLPETNLKTIKCLEMGPIQWTIRVVRQLGNSEFCQDYSLRVNSRVIIIKTTVNWQETHVLVKSSFPLNLESDYTTYEIPFAAIKRTNYPKTPEEKAKWEVSALRWADLTDKSQNYGVSILNNCKYGYDNQSDRLRLTLLKSPRWPDSNCDRGLHHFIYAIYPHQGSWQEAKTVQRGYELNIPLNVVFPLQNKTTQHRTLPPVNQFLNLGSDNLILSALKPAEDHPNTWVLRCYECEGRTTVASVTTSLNLRFTNKVNLLEELIPIFSEITPWKIVSFQAQVKS
ncbi:alpha-mannosidase [Cyanobacterium sp. uoEpiScrs1]|uniref:alpha-mannosidase n=1 Tax=Cyanobacterium sp. uoEpiScrs1 TaxID=2976343 RepID=UPI002269CD33|nr:alpha-mannosidase [Cyanobacterium sp. uoEpiScrs1]